MNEQLSEPARHTLDLVSRGMTPTAAERADAWARLQQTVGRAQYREEFSFRRRVLRGLRYVRGYVRTMWLPLGVVTIVALMIGQLASGDLGGGAQIDMAREALDAGEYRNAYNILADHSRRYHTKDAAEARMGLVIDALCGLKMYDKASDDLERYLELNPESKHAWRADDLCPGEASPR